MSLRLFTNNATATLAGPITSAATSLTLTGGGGAVFPSPSGHQSFRATLIRNGSPNVFEIISVTQRSTDTFVTIVRAQEGTTALAWNAGDSVSLLPTANDMAQFVQFDDLQAQTGNYAADVGSANAYSVTLSPALTAHVVGMPIRFQAAHANTGNSTFNDGAGVAQIIYPYSGTLPANTIVAHAIYTVIWDGTYFQLQVPNLSTYATLAALAAYAPLASPALTGSPTAPTVTPSTDSSTKLATTAFVQLAAGLQAAFLGSPAGNGWVQFPACADFPNGLIVQWGVSSPGGSPGTHVAFPHTFPNSCWVTLASAAGSSGGAVSAYGWTTTYSVQYNTAGGANAWIAIGD